jgi:hypothetical protein
MLRPVPEYTKLSVRSIADSSSVGSRLEDVLAIFVAAIPGATPRPLLPPAPPFEELCTLSSLLLDLVTTGVLTGAEVAAGFGDPPKKLLYAYTTKSSSNPPKTETTTIVFLSFAGAALMACLPSRQ